MVHSSARHQDIKGQREGEKPSVSHPALPKACRGGCRSVHPSHTSLSDLHLYCPVAARCLALSSPEISNSSPRSHSLTTASEPARPLTPPAGQSLDLILIPASWIFPWHWLLRLGSPLPPPPPDLPTRASCQPSLASASNCLAFVLPVLLPRLRQGFHSTCLLHPLASLHAPMGDSPHT